MHKGKIVLITPLYRVDKRTRTIKLLESCSSLGIAVHLVCWDRHSEYPLSSVDDRVESVHVLMRGGGYGGRLMALRYPVWMVRLFFYLLRHRRKENIYCLGFENAFPTFITKNILGNKYIFDDADRFSMIINLPEPAYSTLRFLEKKVSEGSVVNIIPGMARYEFRNNKQKIIRNNPDKKAMARSADIQLKPKVADVVVYLNGWLGETRGLPTALAVASKLSASSDPIAQRIKFIAAGRLEGPCAQKFVGLKNVVYYGEVSNEVALAYYRKADFIFTYYDPNIKINRYAESNKWGDAISYCVPVLVNEEVYTSDFLVDAKCCARFRYDDSDSLLNFLLEAVETPKMIATLKKNMEIVVSQGKTFDVEIKESLEELLA